MTTKGTASAESAEAHARMGAGTTETAIGTPYPCSILWVGRVCVVELAERRDGHGALPLPVDLRQPKAQRAAHGWERVGGYEKCQYKTGRRRPSKRSRGS